MRAIMRELRSLPGAMIGIIFLLIITFWVLNFLRTRAPAPVSGAADWTFGRATGEVYGYGAPAAPAMVVSPYSVGANLGPMI